MVLGAALARNQSSRWSRRYQRRPLATVDGRRPRRARAFTATTEHPSTAAARGAESQSCSASGGCGPRGRTGRGAARRSLNASTWARSNRGRCRRGVRSPRRTILGTADMWTPRIAAASRTVIHSVTATTLPGGIQNKPPRRDVAGVVLSAGAIAIRDGAGHLVVVLEFLDH